ncbi:MAG: hypothetical protein JWQ11_1605 [Rhizobacter sp.]|nr:hypothetical protein [Rhizobacter sp.]
MTRSLPSTVSVPQRLAVCALVLAGALCLFATGEGLRLRVGSMPQFTGMPTADESPSLVDGPTLPVTASQALDNARVNLAKANDAFTRADVDEAARFALTAQDDLEIVKSEVARQAARQTDLQAAEPALASGVQDIEAGLQHLRQQGRSRERARRDAPPMFDFFRGFRDWGNPDAIDEDADSAPSAHPLGPAQPLANGRHIMASLSTRNASTPSALENDRA